MNDFYFFLSFETITGVRSVSAQPVQRSLIVDIAYQVFSAYQAMLLALQTDHLVQNGSIRIRLVQVLSCALEFSRCIV